MSTSSTQLNELFTEIIKHLSNDQSKLRIFKNILLRFKRMPINPILTFEQIKEILSDNSELCDKIDFVCQNFPYETDISTHFSNFIFETNAISKDHPKLGFILAEVISYFSEEFINLPFLHYYSSLLIADLPIEIQKLIHGKIHYLAQEINVHKTMVLKYSQNPTTLPNLIPENFDISPLFSIPPQIQFLSMVHLLISSKDNLYSIIKCLKMYGNCILNDQEAIEWINHFNSFLGDFLKTMLLTSDPSIFLPFNLKSMIEHHIPSEELRIWAIGETLLSLLDNPRNNEPTSSNFSQQTEENVEHHTGENLFLPKSFLSLRHEAFYDSISNSIKNLQNQQEMLYSPAIIDSIYGKHHLSYISKLHKQFIDKDGLFYQRCKELAGQFIDKEVHLIMNAMQQYDPSNNEWRIHYFSLLKPHFVEEMLIFQGTQFEFVNNEGNTIMNRKIMELLNPILTDFISKFNKLSKSFIQEFIQCIQEGVHYCHKNMAICLYYYFVMCHSIQTSLSIKNISLDSNSKEDEKFISELKSIGKKIFEHSFPLEPFENTPLAHFDLPILNFVKMAAKIKTPFLFTDDISYELNDSNELFFFEINSKPESIIIKASANPTVKNAGMLRRRRQDEEPDKDATDEQEETANEEEDSGHEDSEDNRSQNDENEYSE